MTQNDTRLWAADLLSAFSGQQNVLTIPRAYIDITGIIEDALLLSQIIYWTDRTTMDDGWFAKSYAEWHDEIALSKYQVMAATKRLSVAGVETIVKKFNNAPTVHYRLRKLDFELWIVKKLDERKSRNLTMDSKETLRSSTEPTSEPTSKNIKTMPTAASQPSSPKPSNQPAIKPTEKKTPSKKKSKLEAAKEGIQPYKAIIHEMALLCKDGYIAGMSDPDHNLSVDEMVDYALYASEFIRLGGKIENIKAIYEWVDENNQERNWKIAPKSIVKGIAGWQAEQKASQPAPRLVSPSGGNVPALPAPKPMTADDRAAMRESLRAARAGIKQSA